MKKYIVLVLLFIVALACNGPKMPDDVNAEQAAELIKGENVVLVDVRSDDEWDGGHIEGAIHVNYHEEDFDERLAELSKDKEYVVYCHAGGRSAKTVAKMKAAGFENVHNMTGGISGWKEGGYTTVE